MTTWSPESWTARSAGPGGQLPGRRRVRRPRSRVCATLPPLVTSWEIERLRALCAEAQAGRRFLLQGGDCAETLADCQPDVIAHKLKILLQMSLVLIHGAKKPVIRVGRFAGQYAKPRSSPTESRDGVSLPSYFGDLVNRLEFTPEARVPDPELLIQGYLHAALTLNFVRSLSAGGFADLHHPEYWDLAHLSRADLSAELREEYRRTVHQLGEALRFMEALGESTRRRAHPGRVLHEPRGAEPALRGGADQDRPAPRGLLRPHHAPALDRRAHPRARRRPRRVLSRHPKPGRREDRARRHRRTSCCRSSNV